MMYESGVASGGVVVRPLMTYFVVRRAEVSLQQLMRLQQLTALNVHRNPFEEDFEEYPVYFAKVRRVGAQEAGRETMSGRSADGGV